jgi:multidrug efflux pump subunit AcrA (membrane-fusion protein)
VGLRTSDPIHSSNPDGLIVQIHQKAGATVDCTLPIVTIASLETLEVELYVPVQRYCTLKPGGQASLISSAPVNRDIAATVRSVSPVIDSASNTFRCVLIINNTDRKLPAGFSVVLKGSLLPAATPLASQERSTRVAQ